MVNRIIDKTFSQYPIAKKLRDCLYIKSIPEANYYAAYEAGFCGFSVPQSLERAWIKGNTLKGMEYMQYLRSVIEFTCKYFISRPAT